MLRDELQGGKEICRFYGLLQTQKYGASIFFYKAYPNALLSLGSCVPRSSRGTPKCEPRILDSPF